METPGSTSIGDRISFRPVVLPDDEAFLKELYFSTREDLAALIPERHLLEQILTMQYQGQKLTYEQQFPDAAHEVLMLDGEPVGRKLVEEREEQTYFVDLCLLPSARNLGIGERVLRQAFDGARRRGVPLAFHVEKGNPAINLYERLGARVDADDETHFYMVWDTADAE